MRGRPTDKIGQLKTALGFESGGTSRLHEQFGYAYDKAWNLNYRTNNALTETFSANVANELTGISRSGTLTVAGFAEASASPSLTVSGTGLSSGAAAVYSDGTWARAGASPANGANSYTASATDSYGRSSQDNVSVTLTSPVNFIYAPNGNLLNDGQRYFSYDDENQLTSVTVSNAWRSEFTYDGLMRRRKRVEYTWSAGTWLKTNEVRYVYDGRLPIQERDANNLPSVTHTRGNDLSGTLEGAGGIGGLLARTDAGLLTLSSPSGHAYYHFDGNGNVTCLINTSNAVVGLYEYDPFGNLVAKGGVLADANLYRFSSKEYHANSGLSYYLFRYYDSNLQRWINRDPLGEVGFETSRRHRFLPGLLSHRPVEISQGPELFRFVQNDPIEVADINGLECGYNYPSPGVMTGPPLSDKGSVIAGGIIFASAGAGLAVAAYALAPEVLGPTLLRWLGLGAAASESPVGQAAKDELEALDEDVVLIGERANLEDLTRDLQKERDAILNQISRIKDRVDPLHPSLDSQMNRLKNVEDQISKIQTDINKIDQKLSDMGSTCGKDLLP